MLMTDIMRNAGISGGRINFAKLCCARQSMEKIHRACEQQLAEVVPSKRHSQSHLHSVKDMGVHA